VARANVCARCSRAYRSFLVANISCHAIPAIHFCCAPLRVSAGEEPAADCCCLPCPNNLYTTWCSWCLLVYLPKPGPEYDEENRLDVVRTAFTPFVIHLVRQHVLPLLLPSSALHRDFISAYNYFSSGGVARSMRYCLGSVHSFIVKRNGLKQ